MLDNGNDFLISRTVKSRIECKVLGSYNMISFILVGHGKGS